LHTLAREQVASDLLDALPGVRPGPTHQTSLTDLPLGKLCVRLT
jgi:hypothetical protein